jgi:hypothetical protein
MATTLTTIASVGVSPIAINVTIISETEPEFRDNGGDLIRGDRWFSTTTKSEAIFVDDSWMTIQTTSK